METSVTPARRLRPPSWRDGRLVVGIVLVLTATALGARAVAAADHTEPVYVARQALPPGVPLERAQLSVARVRLPSGGHYLRPGQALDGRVLLRVVGAGELVPASAVGSAARLRSRPVAFPQDGPIPEGIRAGALVDVWVSPRAPLSVGAVAGYGAPRLVASQAEVFAIVKSGGGLSVSRGATVQVLIGVQRLPVVLDALANGARTALVPVPGEGVAR